MLVESWGRSLLSEEHRLRNRLSWRKRIIVMLVLFVGIPIPKLMVQKWTVRVIDESGSPLSGILLSEEWENYTFSSSGSDEFRTNDEGFAVFAKKPFTGPWLF